VLHKHVDQYFEADPREGTSASDKLSALGFLKRLKAAVRVVICRYCAENTQRFDGKSLESNKVGRQSPKFQNTAAG